MAKMDVMIGAVLRPNTIMDNMVIFIPDGESLIFINRVSFIYSYPN